MTLYFVYRSYQGDVNHCVTFDVEYLGNRVRVAWLQRTTDRKWHMDYRMVM